jgi:hypothetical protein
VHVGRRRSRLLPSFLGFLLCRFRLHALPLEQIRRILVAVFVGLIARIGVLRFERAHGGSRVGPVGLETGDAIVCRLKPTRRACHRLPDSLGPDLVEWLRLEGGAVVPCFFKVAIFVRCSGSSQRTQVGTPFT